MILFYLMTPLIHTRLLEAVAASVQEVLHENNQTGGKTPSLSTQKTTYFRSELPWAKQIGMADRVPQL